MAGIILDLSDSPTPDVTSVVTELVESLNRCGSAVLQAVSVIQAPSSSDDESRIEALETLRGLSQASQGSASGAECAAYESLRSLLKPESDDAALAESMCMAMFTLGCRNGLPCCEEHALETMELSSAGVSASFPRLAESCTVANMRSASAWGALLLLAVYEVPCKTAPEERA